jgi:hypothetical protein
MKLDSAFFGRPREFRSNNMRPIGRVYCVPLFDGAGVIGCGNDEPEPVVLGGVMVRLAAVGGVERLLAVLLLFFQPAKKMNPITSSNARPATQPYMGAAS